MAYETILVETRGPVALITLNRPTALNALNAQVIAELNRALGGFDADPEIAVMVLTGSERAFAAGADVKEMDDLDFMAAYRSDFIGSWQEVARHRKPIIAAVAGYALGGGCELAMMCDIIIAADNAKFGQPEINLGTIPGAGGTQRLTRAVGKAKAMEMVLTGRMMDAEEAERANLVARVVPAANLIDEALKLAEIIAEKSQPITAMAKEAVNVAYETTLSEGIRFERSASTASIMRPVSTISMALALPIARVRRWVPPAPGMVPRLISGWPNLALSAAMMMSHIIASSQPPPSA
jgi:enoyl-CoA hydratase